MGGGGSKKQATPAPHGIVPTSTTQPNGTVVPQSSHRSTGGGGGGRDAFTASSSSTEAWSCGYKENGSWMPWNMQSIQVTHNSTGESGEKSFAIAGHGRDSAGSFSVQGNIVSSLVEFDKKYDESGHQWTVC